MEVSTRPETVLDPTTIRLGDLYAQALLDGLGDEAADAIATELEAIVDLVDSVPGGRELVLGLLGRSEDRSDRLARIFRDRVSEPVDALMGVLERHGRLAILPAVVRSFRRRLNGRQGRVEVFLTTAVPMDVAEVLRIEQDLAATMGIKPLLRASVDESLIGGAVLRVRDQVYDSSVKTQLTRLRQQVVANSQIAT